MNTNEILKAEAAKHSTDTLLGSLLIIEAKSSLSNEESMTKAAISDAITDRHNLDALMDEIFMDLDYTGAYTDAIIEALARVNA